jgi:tetratricopeptide (TPR) repeat protein
MKELVEIAVLAYRAGRYHDAIELFLQALDFDATNYGARLYLAMAYERAGMLGDAQRLAKRLTVDCPDEEIQRRAQAMLPLIEAELRSRYGREKEKKSPLPMPKTKDADDIVWVG